MLYSLLLKSTSPISAFTKSCCLELFCLGESTFYSFLCAPYFLVQWAKFFGLPLVDNHYLDWAKVPFLSASLPWKWIAIRKMRTLQGHRLGICWVLLPCYYKPADVMKGDGGRHWHWLGHSDAWLAFYPVYLWLAELATLWIFCILKLLNCNKSIPSSRINCTVFTCCGNLSWQLVWSEENKCTLTFTDPSPGRKTCVLFYICFYRSIVW